MKTYIILSLVVTVTLAGCAGQEARPVQVTMPGDADLNCAALQVAIAEVDSNIKAKKNDKVQKDGYNAMLFVGGCFLIVPFFFMDFKKSQEIELDALMQRRAHFRALAAQKECEFIKDDQRI